jgi:hypothetical protein
MLCTCWQCCLAAAAPAVAGTVKAVAAHGLLDLQ